jgi:AraC family transcriptional regulator of adaptative response/methylated-DNA-[protein]-cysteine methyltransferase
MTGGAKPAGDERWLDEASRQYQVVARTIDYLRAHAGSQPQLDELAGAAHVSPQHLQRVFSAWAGISPKRFLQYLTKEYALAALGQARDTLQVSLDAGLSSTSRLHELMVSCEAMTPAEIRAAGFGVQLDYGIGPSPFGEALVAWTRHGICHVAFCGKAISPAIGELLDLWPAATAARDDMRAREMLGRIFPHTPERGKLHLLLRGTNFQIKVWEALMQSAPGERLSYSELAHRAGSPQAVRAVGSALARNHIAYLIPCHRVIRDSGEVGQFRWGSTRKLAMQGWESARGSADCTT